MIPPRRSCSGIEAFASSSIRTKAAPASPFTCTPSVRGGEAKFWLHPAHVVGSDGLDARTLRELSAVVDENSELIERSWHEHFG